MWQNPVFDRTLFDVQSKSAKAYMNTADLNRIENNILYLAQLLGCAVETKVWADGEFVFTADLERIKSNLQILTKAYKLTPKSPDIPSMPYNLFSRWNDIEKIIYDIYSLFNANKEAVFYCGEAYSGSQIGVI